MKSWSVRRKICVPLSVIHIPKRFVGKKVEVIVRPQHIPDTRKWCDICHKHTVRRTTGPWGLICRHCEAQHTRSKKHGRIHWGTTLWRYQLIKHINGPRISSTYYGVHEVVYGRQGRGKRKILGITGAPEWLSADTIPDMVEHLTRVCYDVLHSPVLIWDDKKDKLVKQLPPIGTPGLWFRFRVLLGDSKIMSTMRRLYRALTWYATAGRE